MKKLMMILAGAALLATSAPAFAGAAYGQTDTTEKN